MSTIVDVCKLAGVSKATVSRVINGNGPVKESTRHTVYSAMEQLGYRPNTVARALATNETSTLGFVVSDFNGIHFGLLLKQASASTEAANKQLLVTDGHNDPDKEYEAIRKIEGSCDAIVLYSRTPTDAHINQLAKQLTVPLVVMNRLAPNPLCHVIAFDQQGAVEMMVDYLVSCGHSKIACITGTLNNPTGQARLAGYKNSLLAHGMAFDQELVVYGEYFIESGYRACKELIDKGVDFTAMVAFNDHMAFGALKALSEVGISVPEQVSIIGIDDDPTSSFSSPTLTTVELPIEKMTKHAIELALALTKDKKTPSFHLYTGRLIKRESVIPCADDI
ncbi:LacI family DNA-binding transcriptional regulator [Photobacterium rosenbergii]|uniref:LacI family DNA-binding transcriptional regulator n=1 Tax=Photobacterium rosenbergii TaxID=294936 RepID=A0ABU3ZNE6_9GAMM|nr:LacI family DNA-binding transcriptional regulator [Photobacterium rosenbergii]MDV5171622.1 LacI family DNA-binding transcriptional regulator [Photobacterium rosenbergii]